MFTGPHIVTDGLVLHLDAANTKSYPGSGTTWSDVSGNGNTGTLVNGPTFDSQNGGSIVFDGVSNYVNTNYQIPAISTIEIIINPDASNSTTNGFLDGWSASNIQGILMTRVSSNTSRLVIGNGVSFSPVNFTTTNNVYTIITIVNTGSQSLIYTNGIYQTNNTLVYIPGNNLRIGARLSNSVNYWKGFIPSITIYNRALTPQEVLQNYNATKTRFNL